MSSTSSLPGFTVVKPRCLGLARRILQTRDGRLRRQRSSAFRTAANRHLHQRIMPQPVEIDGVLVAARDRRGAHDLAVLEQLFRHPEETSGSGRYLLTANSYLARALRTRYQRWNLRWTPADGLVSPSNTVRAVMAKHALSARSPTALQHYAACPYKFFLQAVHRLAPREVPQAIDELDPLQRGSLIHDVQFALF